MGGKYDLFGWILGWLQSPKAEPGASKIRLVEEEYNKLSLSEEQYNLVSLFDEEYYSVEMREEPL